MQQIGTSAPTSDSFSPGWISTVYSTQSHKTEERTHRYTQSRNKNVSTETGKKNVIDCAQADHVFKEQQDLKQFRSV